MIRIGTPFITQEGGRAYLKAKVTITEDTAAAYVKNITPRRSFCVWLTDEDYPPASWDSDGTLWFDVPLEYSRYLCTERSNSFVIALLWYAIVSGSDIEFESPMSKRLYDGITTMLMPELAKAGFAPVALVGPVTNEPVWCEGGVVAGMSGGVDSTYTLKCYTSDSVPEDIRLTHLCHYTCGYLFKPGEVGRGVDALYDSEDKIEDIVLDRARQVAQAKGLPLVDSNSNIDRDFYRGGYIYMGMYRYLASTLALEHLYKLYISSSSGHVNDQVEVSLFAPTQHYEGLLCSSLQTETFRYMSSDNDSRIRKLKAVADDEVFQKTASVCFATGPNGENCGECYGCWKTMVPLDVIGKLDKFDSIFDLDKYYANREEIFRDLITFARRPEASSARETVKQVMDEIDAGNSGKAGELFKKVYEAES